MFWMLFLFLGGEGAGGRYLEFLSLGERGVAQPPSPNFMHD